MGDLPRGGFTITELIIVVTLVTLLAALAIAAYNKEVNDTRVAKSASLVTALATAKSMFVADKNTTPAQIAAFNSAPESNFAMIAPYIRINGATPQDMNDLLSLCGIPSSGVTVTIGAFDDGTSSGGNIGNAPTVTGYGYHFSSARRLNQDPERRFLRLVGSLFVPCRRNQPFATLGGVDGDFNSCLPPALQELVVGALPKSDIRF